MSRAGSIDFYAMIILLVVNVEKTDPSIRSLPDTVDLIATHESPPDPLP